jgi:hypothetical protein
MTDGVGYRLVAGPDFDLDYRRIDLAASRNPFGPEAALRREVVRAMLDLAAGKADGHHALSHLPEQGDLRDCVTVHLRSDPHRPADYRLVFRESRPAAPRELARRELLAIKPRRGRNDVYAHVCSRLNRHPNDRQPGLDRFDNWGEGSGGLATRQAQLDAKRAIAHAWDGQQPLRSARPVLIGAPSRAPDPAEGVPRARATEGGTDASQRAAPEPTGHPSTPTVPPPNTPSEGQRPRNSGPAPTGWPGRSR